MPHGSPHQILHIIDRLDGYGHARMVRYLAARQATGPARVAVVASNAEVDVANELRASGATVVDLQRRWVFDPLALLRLRRLRQNLNADIVHAWDPASLLYAAWTPSRRKRETLIETIDAAAKSSGLAGILAAARRRVTAFVLTDEGHCEALLSQGISSNRVHVIRPAAAPSLDSTPVDRPACRERLCHEFGWPTNAILIAVCGPLERHKQIDEAIWCFELVRVLHERARLLILGDGSDRSRLVEFAQQVTEADCVAFAGYRQNAAELLKFVDIYWQLDAAPSTPWALIEAMAAGAAIVASDTPHSRHALADGKAGRLVIAGSRAQVARATDDLICDPALARQFGEAAANESAANWSLDAAMSDYEKLYVSVKMTQQA